MSGRSREAKSGDGLQSTHWSLVLRARGQGDPSAGAALADLCEKYWQPPYFYVRRRISDVNTAQDLTQEFFSRLLEKRLIEKAAPEKGRFRAFLLTSLKNFLANEWARAGAEKRGGKTRLLSFDLDSAESGWSSEPVHHLTPDRLFVRKWAQSLLEHVMMRLEREYRDKGKEMQFAVLKDVIAADMDRAPFAQTAEKLGISEAAARQSAHRMRKRFRELLRQEVALTVEEDQVESELGDLFEAVRD